MLNKEQVQHLECAIKKRWESGGWCMKTLIVVTIASPFIFGMGFIFLGLILVKSAARDFIESVKSYSWPKVTGTILSSSVFHQKGDPGFGTIYDGTPDRYCTRIGYEYSVSGRYYRSGKVRVGMEFGYLSSNKADRLVSTYASGKLVNVYHHPDKPEISCLMPGLTPGIVLMQFTPYLIMATGAAVIFGWVYGLVTWVS